MLDDADIPEGYVTTSQAAKILGEGFTPAYISEISRAGILKRTSVIEPTPNRKGFKRVLVNESDVLDLKGRGYPVVENHILGNRYDIPRDERERLRKYWQ